MEPDRQISRIFHPIRKLTRIFRTIILKIKTGKKLVIGKNTYVGKNCEILSPKFAKIGNNVRIGSRFHCETNLEICDHVLISSNVSFIGNDHKFDDPENNIFFQGRNPTPTIILEGDNLIGYGATLLGDITIAYGTIIGARSLVTKSTQPNMIYAGIPAKAIKARHTPAIP